MISYRGKARVMSSIRCRYFSLIGRYHNAWVFGYNKISTRISYVVRCHLYIEPQTTPTLVTFQSDYLPFSLQALAIRVQMTRIEHGGSGCLYDNLTITDGTDVLLLCGTTYNQLFRTNEPVTVVFRTDGSVTMRGFKLEYTVIAPTDDTPYQLPTHTRRWTICTDSWYRDWQSKERSQGLYWLLNRRRLIGAGVPIINLKWSLDHLKFIMGIPIPVRWSLHSWKGNKLSWFQ